MPIYMDRHIVPGITLADAAEAHQADVAIQDEYDCKAVTYWLDEERGCAFCLIKAPNMQAVRDLHDNSHGLIPHEIMEVEEDVVMAFLGRIHDPEPEKTDDGEATAIFCEPGYRAIMTARLNEAALIQSGYKKRERAALFKAYNTIIDEALSLYGGREVRHTGDGFIASFDSISKSVTSASDIHQEIKKLSSQRGGTAINVAIGISAGDPVTGADELFGEAVQLAERLCYLSAYKEKIMITPAVRDKYGSHRFKNLSGTNPIESLNTSEEEFLIRLMDVIEQSWNRDELTLQEVCREIGISRAQLYRNITSLTGLSFVDFIKGFRLKQALTLIEKHPDNIARVAYETGFNNPSYFAKCFKQQYDVLPSEYARSVS